MRLALIATLFLSATLAAGTTAWAQNTQRTAPAPLPAGAPAPPRQAMGYGVGPGRSRRIVIRRGAMGRRPVMLFRGRFSGAQFGPMRYGMAGRRGPAFMDFGGTARLRGLLFGFGAGLARMVNNPNFRQRLGITDAQASQIRQQSMNFHIAQIRSRAGLQVDALQLRQLLTAQNPDSAAIDQKLGQISTAQLAQRKQAVAYLLAMRHILTPQQRQELQQMRQMPLRRGSRAPAARPAPAVAPPPNNR